MTRNEEYAGGFPPGSEAFANLVALAGVFEEGTVECGNVGRDYENCTS